MSRYLDPKADLTFKKIFAEHKDLMISFLNALLPLDDGDEVKEIEYLPVELIPETPLKKDTIVDVRCIDQLGRSFVVEMQMIWTAEFMKRVLFNTSKAYVKQLDKGGDYIDLQPVFSLNLVNDTFRDDDECYHDYGLIDVKTKDDKIELMHLIFYELPKFKPHNYSDKKMMVLWLRFLTEIDEKTKKVPEELMENPETRKALGIVEESAYDDREMATYDHFWDAVSRERTLVSASIRKGMTDGFAKGLAKGVAKGMAEGRAKGIVEGRAKGIAEGRAKGIAEGRVEGEAEANRRNAKAMKDDGMAPSLISKYSGLTLEEIEGL